MSTLNPTFYELWVQDLPEGRRRFAHFLATVTGCLLLALAAQIHITITGTSVPVTGQTLAVLLVGMLLGPLKGMLAVILYILAGGLGLPFFAGGSGGWDVVVGLRGGYLFGFIVAATTIGIFARLGWERNLVGAFISSTIGASLIFVVGIQRLKLFLPPGQAMDAGFYPFIMSSIVQIVLVTVAIRLIWLSRPILPELT